MLGATDHRVGAVAADITWNNLARSLFPNALANLPVPASGPGCSRSCGPATCSPAASARATRTIGAAGRARFQQLRPVRRRAVRQLPAGGRRRPPDLRLATLLAESSPASVLAGMRAPTLLTQGEQDSLFPLSEADANARQISAAGAPVVVRWRSGGHDAPGAGDDVTGMQRRFFDSRLRGGPDPGSGFELAQPGAGISASSGRTVETTLRAAGYPGLAGRAGFASRPIVLHGAPQPDQRAGRRRAGGGVHHSGARGPGRRRGGPGPGRRRRAVPAARPERGVQLRARCPSPLLVIGSSRGQAHGDGRRDRGGAPCSSRCTISARTARTPCRPGWCRRSG